jgi:hypothetical protein
MTMTWDDVAELLAFCAVYDRRKGDKLDINAWLMVATDHRWTRDLAFRVAREHYGAGADRPRLEPAAITDRIRHMRGRAAESFEAPRIPDDLSNRDYPAWLRAQLAAHCDAVLGRWAATGEEPPNALPPAPVVVGTRRELEAATPPPYRPVIAPGLRNLYERTIRDDGGRRPKTAEQRAQARAELDAIRESTEDAS